MIRQIQPLNAEEFEYSALLQSLGAASMGVFPETLSINDDLLEAHKLQNFEALR